MKAGETWIRLTVFRGWKIRGAIFLAGLVILLIVIGTIVWTIARDPSYWPLGLVLILVVAVLYLYDPILTQALRFRFRSDAYLNATPLGVMGKIYPDSSYFPRGSLFVIRSLIFRHNLDAIPEKNFVPWSYITIRLGRMPKGVWLEFLSFPRKPGEIWGHPPSRESSILRGVTCVVAESSLAALILVAVEGGADVHVRSDMLSAIGRASGMPCSLHDSVISRIPGRYARVRPALSIAEASSWFVPVSSRRGTA